VGTWALYISMHGLASQLLFEVFCTVLCSGWALYSRWWMGCLVDGLHSTMSLVNQAKVYPETLNDDH
jgi:hypothetical protein